MQKLLLLLIVILLFQSSRAGTVDTINIYSTSMKKDIKCVVIQPDNYKNSGKYLPVVYLLHGYGNNYTQWLKTAPQLKDRVDQLNMLIVCSDGGYGSWYFDSPVDSSVRYETFISKELVSYIDSHYRTDADRRHRAITGLSMGGHGALYIAIRHKNIFGAAGSTSGVVDFPALQNNHDTGKDTDDTVCCKVNWEKNAVLYEVDHLKNGDLKLIFDCGVNDLLIYANRKLHQKLLDKKIDHDYSERPGRHTAAYWENSIDYQLLFFKKYFEEK